MHVHVLHDDAVRILRLHPLCLRERSHFLGQLELVCFGQNAFALSFLHRSDGRQSFCFCASRWEAKGRGERSVECVVSQAHLRRTFAVRFRRRIAAVFGQRHTDRHDKNIALLRASEQACALHSEDQALPKIGFGTHFSDLSNILPNGAEPELEVSAGRLEAELIVADGLFEAVVLEWELVFGVLILRFWNAFLMPPLDCVVPAKRVADDAGEGFAEVCLQLCWLGAR